MTQTNSDNTPQQSTSTNPQSQTDFRLPANDEKGHGVPVHVRVPPSYLKQLEIIVTSKHWPYQTASDVVRHALKRHMEWLSTLASIPSVIHQTNAINEILVEEGDKSTFLEIIDELAKKVGEAVAAGRLGPARELLARVMGEIDGMPEGWWKEQYRAVMGERFKGLLDRPEAASLAELVEDNSWGGG